MRPEFVEGYVGRFDRLTANDDSETRYIGRLSMAVQTPVGVSNVPVSFEIDASGIVQAFEKFGALADAAIENAKKELQEQVQEMRRKAQSRIVTPGELGGGMGNIRM